MDYDLIFYHSSTSDNKEYNQYGIHNIIYKNAITWNIKSFQLLKKINFRVTAIKMKIKVQSFFLKYALFRKAEKL